MTETYYICPQCDYFSNARLQEKFCSNCGTRLLMACPGCQSTINNPYAKFCSDCGQQLKEVLAAQWSSRAYFH
jgi:membrane protease subunit (stomatin/prohibitin family)